MIENGEIEELHYLSVKVERMKKAMLNRVEGLELGGESAIGGTTKEKMVKAAGSSSNALVDDNDRKEEMLYRSMDNLVDTQTGGGDIVNVHSSVENSIAKPTSQSNAHSA